MDDNKYIAIIVGHFYKKIEYNTGMILNKNYILMDIINTGDSIAKILERIK